MKTRSTQSSKPQNKQYSQSRSSKKDKGRAPEPKQLAAQADTSTQLQHHQLIAPDAIPWDAPVDGQALIAEIQDEIGKYTVMTTQERLTVALWAIFSYCADLAMHAPYLAFQSPTMRCGKTTALAVIKALAWRPMMLAHVTGPSLYRLIHEHSPTALIDEVDQIIHRNHDLRVVLNAAHNRASACIPRTEKGTVVPFRVYGPKALACIGKLPETLQDRSIVISLRRKLPGQHVERLPSGAGNPLGDTARRIARWVQDNTDKISTCSPPTPSSLHNRAEDNWRPLLAIAEVIGPGVGAMARAAAVEISRAADEESVDLAEQLLRDIKIIFNDHPAVQVIPVAQLHRRLLKRNDGRWKELHHGQSLSKERMGRMLSAFGIKSDSTRNGETVARCYLRASFEDAFARYCPEPENKEES